ncbi:MAG: gamma-glutamylcyclotransferase [Syntrophobacteraceae bacterium]
MNPELRVFVYGTLKKGFSNHDRYCSGLLQAEPASVRGRLFKLTPTVPVMLIPEEDVLAYGTTNICADLETQEKFESAFKRQEAEQTRTEKGSWRCIQGDLLIFGDPEKRLPLLDELEEFHPGGSSTYLRVLVSTVLREGSRSCAWTYIAGFNTEKLDEYDAGEWFPDGDQRAGTGAGT